MKNDQMDMKDIMDVQEYKSHNRLLQGTDTVEKAKKGQSKKHKLAYGLIPFSVLIAVLLYYSISVGNTKVSAAEDAATLNAAITNAAAELAAAESTVDKTESDTNEALAFLEDDSEAIAYIPGSAVETKSNETETEDAESSLNQEDTVVFGSAAQAFAGGNADPVYTSTTDTDASDAETMDGNMDSEDSMIGILFEDDTPEEVRWQLLQEQMRENAYSLLSKMGVAKDYEMSDPELPDYLTKTYNQDMVMSLTDEELNALLKLVEAEAPAEDIYGKILVANVVLNRVLSDEMADTVLGVIYQKIGGSAQFSSTTHTWYWNSIKVTNSTREAVARALSGEDYSQGAVYFYAWKNISSSKANWFNNNTVYLFTHGGHKLFASENK